jgi:tetratricopeptide (TPR) repeat protein
MERSLGIAAIEQHPGQVQAEADAPRVRRDGHFQRLDDFRVHRHDALPSVRSEADAYDTVQVDTLHPAALVGRGRLLLRALRPEEAARIFAQAIAADPANASAHRWMSVCMLQLQRPKEALRLANQAIALEPEHEWGHRLRSAALLKLKRRRRALAAAREAVRLSPENWFALSHLAHVELANGLRGHRTAARRAAEEAIRIAPESPVAHNALGAVELGYRKPHAAEAAFRRALAIDAENTDALTNLGTALRMQGRPRDARDHYASSSRTDPRSGIAAQHAAALSNLLLAITYLPTQLVLFAAAVAAVSARDHWLALLSLPAIGAMVVVHRSVRRATRVYRPRLFEFTFSWRGGLVAVTLSVAFGLLGTVLTGTTSYGFVAGCIALFGYAGARGFGGRWLSQSAADPDRRIRWRLVIAIALFALVAFFLIVVAVDVWDLTVEHAVSGRVNDVAGVVIFSLLTAGGIFGALRLLTNAGRPPASDP